MNEEQFNKLLEGKSDDERKVLTDLYQESQKNHSLKSDAFKERDELKNRLKAIEEAKQKELEELAKEQGKYKELYETTAPKLSKLEELEKENNTYKAQLQAIEDETRKELLERFPDGKKEIVKDLPINKLRELAKLETNETITTDKSKKFAQSKGIDKPVPKTFHQWAEQFVNKGN